MMEVNRLPKSIINYRPRGQKHTRMTSKKTFPFEAGTGCGLVPICRRIKLDTLEDGYNGSNTSGFMIIN
jgi:hypothetical protein